MMRRADGEESEILHWVLPDGSKALYADMNECESIRTRNIKTEYRGGPHAPSHVHLWVTGKYDGHDWCRNCGLLRVARGEGDA